MSKAFKQGYDYPDRDDFKQDSFLAFAIIKVTIAPSLSSMADAMEIRYLQNQEAKWKSMTIDYGTEWPGHPLSTAQAPADRSRWSFRQIVSPQGSGIAEKDPACPDAHLPTIGSA